MYQETKIIPKPIKIPGIIPAMNILDTESPVMVAAMIIGTDGGMIGPIQEEAAVTAQEKSAS